MQLTPATHRQVLSFIWQYTRTHLWLLLLMIVLLLLSTGIQLIQPFFYKQAVDTVANSDTGNRLAYLKALQMIAIGVLMGALHITLHEVATKMLAWIETRVMPRAHADVFAHTQRLSTQFHVNSFAGSTSRKIGRGTDSIETMLDIIWFNFLPLIAVMIGFVVALWWFAPLIGFAIALSILIYTPISIALNLYHAKLHSWTDRQDTRVTASLVDSITGNATIKAFSKERFEEDRHGAVLGEWQRRMWHTWQLGNTLSHFQSMLLMLVEAVLLLLTVYLWHQGQLTPGAFVVVLFYVGILWGHMHNIGKNVRNYLRANAHAQEMVGLYLTTVGVADKEDAKDLAIGKGEVSFRNITFTYDPQSPRAFEGFSVDIKAGEKVALVGHSGGGKSTFVKLLLRLYDVQKGAIAIDNQDITDVTQDSLRKNIGLIPQDPILFHRSIAENIAYGKPDASPEEIERVAKIAHAHEFIERLPKGYQTLVGERGVKLSGGERQRVAIARAILADTPILVLDEATSSLDSESEQFIQEALEYLMQDRTTIVIAHRLSTIKKADRILVIEQGHIVEQGTHGQLVRKENGVYKHFYELQAGGFIGD